MDISKVVEALNNIANRNLFDYLTFLISILSLISSAIFTWINIKVVNNNTNKQIENQNKETYRPRLRLKSIKNCLYDFNDIYLYAYSKDYNAETEKSTIYVEMELENIGNGVANDLTFYMLHDAEKCIGIQNVEMNINQELNSTIEIPKNSIQNVKFCFNFYKKDDNSLKSNFGNNDTILLIYDYKDLSNNSYKILIGCILKKYDETIRYSKNKDKNILIDSNFDFYYYQENTKEYDNMIENEIYKNNYIKIKKDLCCNYFCND